MVAAFLAVDLAVVLGIGRWEMTIVATRLVVNPPTIGGQALAVPIIVAQIIVDPTIVDPTIVDLADQVVPVAVPTIVVVPTMLVPPIVRGRVVPADPDLTVVVPMVSNLAGVVAMAARRICVVPAATIAMRGVVATRAAATIAVRTTEIPLIDPAPISRTNAAD